MSTSSSAEAFRPDLFARRSVLVVGGSSGIGLAIAGGFARHGAEVTATGVSEAELSGVSASGLALRALDVTDAVAVERVVEASSPLDVLVVCAGIIRRGEEHRPEAFAEVVAINLVGAMRVCAAARAGLARTGGSVLLTASMLSFFGGGHAPAYAASKGGIAQLTKSLAIAYAADRVRVNALAPGWIRTPLTAAVRDDPARAAALLARTPLGRWGEPEDLVGAALFLASPAASFVTGAILPVDGGFLVA